MELFILPSLWVQGQTTKLKQNVETNCFTILGQRGFPTVLPRLCADGFSVIIIIIYYYIILLVNVQLFPQNCDHMYWRTSIQVSNCNYLVLRIYFSNGCFRLIFKLFTSYYEKIKKNGENTIIN